MRTAALGLSLTGLLAATASADQRAERDYYVLVASEAVDRIALVRFGPGGLVVEREKYLGLSLTEQVGPHGVAVSPDRGRYFVTTAHGQPNGSLRRFDAVTGEHQGRVELGMFPATVQVSPDGFYVYVTNFNLWGAAVPSSVSVVAAEELVEIARIDTCVMPHGSRFTSDGTRHYSTCMMSDMLIEIDTHRLQVARHFILAAGREQGMAGAPDPAHHGATHQPGDHAMDPPRPGDGSCQPTWAEPAPDGTRVWVACSKSSELVEVDAGRWTVARRIPAGPGIYNLGLTSDGSKVIATNRRDQSMSVFEAGTGRELARIPTSKKVVSGVAISDDDLYAFVTAEGAAGAEVQAGSLDVIDLASLTRVASVELGAQAGGVAFWKSSARSP